MFHSRLPREFRGQAVVPLLVAALASAAGPRAPLMAGEIPHALTASGRADAAAVYDTVRDRMILIGGHDGGYHNDVVVLALGASEWSALEVAGTPPSPRSQHTAIYDPVRDRVIVFGGFDGTSRLSDAWELTLSGTPTWNPLPSASVARARHTAIYDPARDRMLVFGGAFNDDDVFALSLAGAPAWSVVPGATNAGATQGHCAIYAAAGDRMIVYQPNGNVEALALSGAPAWSALDPRGPRPTSRRGASAVFDAARSRMMIFGGFDGAYRGDVYALNLTGAPAWGLVSPPGASPPGRSGQVAIVDPARDRLVVFGGADGAQTYGDLWRLPLAGAPEWRTLSTSGTPPGPRAAHSMIYDPVRDRMIVYGGESMSGVQRDAWAFSMGDPLVWSLLADGPTAPARGDHTALYDPVRDRMIVFGGYDQNGFDSNATWALSLSGTPTWSVLTTAGTPPPATDGHDAVYDPVRDRMIVIGGSATQGRAFALTLAGTPTWSELPSAPGSVRPTIAVYDPVRDRVVTRVSCVLCTSLWQLTLADTPAWSTMNTSGNPQSEAVSFETWHLLDAAQDRVIALDGWDGVLGSVSLAGPGSWEIASAWGPALSRRWDAAVVHDPVRNRLVAFGGMQAGVAEYIVYDDVHAISLDLPPPWEEGTSLVAVPARPSNDHIALDPGFPNPAHDAFTIRFELPSARTVSLRVLDAGGRCVQTLCAGRVTAGAHTLVWDARTAAGRRVSPGIYFYELRAPGRRISRRVAVLD